MHGMPRFVEGDRYGLLSMSVLINKQLSRGRRGRFVPAALGSTCELGL